MGYRCNDKAYLKQLKDDIDSKDSTPDYTWKYLYKYLYLDDLYIYSTALFKGQAVERGVGNLNSKIVFVLDTLDNTKNITLLKSIFNKINVDFNKLYVTSFHKTTTATEEQCNDILERELSGIKPEIIFQVGSSFNYSNNSNLDVKVIPEEVINALLNSKDEDEIKINKKIMWNTIKLMIPLIDCK